MRAEGSGKAETHGNRGGRKQQTEEEVGKLVSKWSAGLRQLEPERAGKFLLGSLRLLDLWDLGASEGAGCRSGGAREKQPDTLLPPTYLESEGYCPESTSPALHQGRQHAGEALRTSRSHSGELPQPSLGPQDLATAVHSPGRRVPGV